MSTWRRSRTIENPWVRRPEQPHGSKSRPHAAAQLLRPPCTSSRLLVVQLLPLLGESAYVRSSSTWQQTLKERAVRHCDVRLTCRMHCPMRREPAHWTMLLRGASARRRTRTSRSSLRTTSDRFVRPHVRPLACCSRTRPEVDPKQHHFGTFRDRPRFVTLRTVSDRFGALPRLHRHACTHVHVHVHVHVHMHMCMYMYM